MSFDVCVGLGLAASVFAARSLALDCNACREGDVACTARQRRALYLCRLRAVLVGALVFLAALHFLRAVGFSPTSVAAASTISIVVGGVYSRVMLCNFLSGLIWVACGSLEEGKKCLVSMPSGSEHLLSRPIVIRRLDAFVLHGTDEDGRQLTLPYSDLVGLVVEDDSR